MELHRQLPASIKKYEPSLESGAKSYFKTAQEFVEKFFSKELKYVFSTNFANVHEDLFFREYVWVVYASGFSAKVVSKMHPKLMEVYGFYDHLAQKNFENKSTP